jgi:2-polyprenyl-3-methyl-5-hydroxy-6-metoxy-1,4-benzoquinol methylase
MKTNRELSEDFDAIANALQHSPEREVLSDAEDALLRHVPRGAKHGLDAGCGDGVLTRVLARRGIAMLGLDLSPRMIALARSRTDATLPVEYRVGDIISEAQTTRTFDLVLTVAMVHHLPLDVIVPRLASLVAPNGTLLIQDILTRPGLRNLPINVVAALRRRLHRLVDPSYFSRALTALYDKHGAGEVYLTPEGATAAYSRLLPGARAEHHLEWRYSVVWQRSANT